MGEGEGERGEEKVRERKRERVRKYKKERGLTELKRPTRIDAYPEAFTLQRGQGSER
jgi:hypothetical protein